MRWVAVLMVLMLLACEQVPPAAFVRLSEARQLTAALQTELAQGAEAITAVVVRDASARARADQARRALDRDLAQLEPIVRGLAYEPEAGLMTRVHAELTRDRALEQQLLALTGEGSNVAAQELSFGAAHEAIDRFQHAAPQAFEAAYALRSMQALEGPHIAEADEAKMDALEERMARLEAQARAAAPSALLDEFLTVHARILALSRRNTNVHALALAIGDKRAAYEACAGTLAELSERLQARTFPATR